MNPHVSRPAVSGQDTAASTASLAQQETGQQAGRSVQRQARSQKKIPRRPHARMTPLEYIKTHLQERQCMEAADGQFQFPPLITCLENMLAFTRHIRGGRQFPESPNAVEAAAMAQQETGRSVQPQVRSQKKIPMHPHDRMTMRMGVSSITSVSEMPSYSLEPLLSPQMFMHLSTPCRSSMNAQSNAPRLLTIEAADKAGSDSQAPSEQP